MSAPTFNPSSNRGPDLARVRNNSRRGVATIEFAVCLPLLATFCFGCIEACSMIYLKQSLTIAAYEGGRTANSIGASTSDVLTTCNQILSDRGITGHTVVTTPTEIATVNAGSFFVVECSAPTTANSLVPPWFFNPASNLSGRSEFIKKY